jgi:hypothetical protein
MRRRGEEGYTLSEVCIAVIILAAAIVTAVGALSSAIFVSRQHRDVVTSDELVRRYAEQLIAAPYQDCATPATYLASSPPAGVPASYTVTITSITYSDGGNPVGYGAACPGTGDAGTQLIRVQASHTGGAGMQVLRIVKREP